jgi:hypothetical protein
MRDRDLRTSLAAIGQLESGLRYEGELLDGRRRETLCSELGIRFEVRDASSLQEACSVLWARSHAARALELAGKRPLLELAELCGTNTAAVAAQLQAMKPKRSHKAEARDSATRLRTSPVMMRRLVTFEPELYAAAKEAAKQAGHGNFARLVRDALRREVRDLVGAILPRRVQAPNGARRKTG